MRRGRRPAGPEPAAAAARGGRGGGDSVQRACGAARRSHNPESGGSVTGLLGGPIEVANVGLELFAGELERQGVAVERVDWRPPAEGDDALRRLVAAAQRIARAHDEAGPPPGSPPPPPLRGRAAPPPPPP